MCSNHWTDLGLHQSGGGCSLFAQNNTIIVYNSHNNIELPLLRGTNGPKGSADTFGFCSVQSAAAAPWLRA